MNFDLVCFKEKCVLFLKLSYIHGNIINIYIFYMHGYRVLNLES